jgi:hypothetical protein
MMSAHSPFRLLLAFAGCCLAGGLFAAGTTAAVPAVPESRAAAINKLATDIATPADAIRVAALIFDLLDEKRSAEPDWDRSFAREPFANVLALSQHLAAGEIRTDYFPTLQAARPAPDEWWLPDPSLHPGLLALCNTLAAQGAFAYLGPDAPPPARAEKAEKYLERALAAATAKEDWPTAWKALLLTCLVPQKPREWMVENMDAMDYYLTGLEQELARDYVAAVTSYCRALRSTSRHVPARAIGLRLAQIKAFLPGDYEDGVRRAAQPDLNLSAAELGRLYDGDTGLSQGPRGSSANALGVVVRQSETGEAFYLVLPPEERNFLRRIFAASNAAATGYSQLGPPDNAPAPPMPLPPGSGTESRAKATVAPPASTSLIERNLNQFLAAARRHFAAAADTEVTGARLLADPANTHLRDLPSFAGEDYAKLVLRRAATSLTISTAVGGVVSVSTAQQLPDP